MTGRQGQRPASPLPFGHTDKATAMSRDVQLSAEPLEHIDQLVEYFASGEKSADRFL